MIVAAIETSSRVGSVALLLGDTIHQVQLENQRRHASDLLPALGGLLDEAGLEVGRLEAVCVGIGPGSYTGLRVGVATALGLSLSARTVLRAVPSFEALAFEQGQNSQEYCVALDARAKGWYFARYLCEQDRVCVIDAPCILEAEELLQRLSPVPTASIDKGVAQLLESNGIDTGTFSRRIDPSAGSVARLGLHGLLNDGPHGPSDCEPLYLRPFAVKTRRR